MTKFGTICIAGTGSRPYERANSRKGEVRRCGDNKVYEVFGRRSLRAIGHLESFHSLKRSAQERAVLSPTVHHRGCKSCGRGAEVAVPTDRCDHQLSTAKRV